MVRPRRCRRVRFRGDFYYFKPRGIPINELEEIELRVEEFEALRLKDLENMDQNKAAEKMEISQSTFHRILIEARKKVADALVNGKAIKIEGGDFKRKS
ncbi:DUF134 domain-containing protein [archaeon]|jgi:uncharacterized protein|nr:DUF134 domain-containing protein [archaeon]MBT4396693.1 DUF134 domain-containing protein [archaeon]MBT4441303.1 DUF134 domain-containing protein [archaeon]